MVHGQGLATDMKSIKRPNKCRNMNCVWLLFHPSYLLESSYGGNSSLNFRNDLSYSLFIFCQSLEYISE